MDIQKILQRHPPEKSGILNILHELQDEHPQNYLPDEILLEVAGYLNIPLSSVYGVVEYYSMFRTRPRGRKIIRVCRSPVCHLMGSGTVLESLKKVLDCAPDEVTPDGLFSVELSECLGICDVAPAMMVDEVPYGYLTENSIRSIIAEIRNESEKKQT